ncbi:MAG TPA: hypothetical protein VD993_15690 [Chitinophagaceae bacterium]|nr:hypothetical protein [Chitinophagaceae bacterium]
MNEEKILWYSAAKKTFFLVAAATDLPKGNDELQDMSGNTINTDITLLQPHECTAKQAQQHLEQEWNEAVEQSKRAWAQLYRLTELSGRGYDMEQLKKSLLDGLSTSGSGVAHEAFGHGKAAVEELLKAVEAGDPGSPEEEQNIFKNIFRQMPGLENLMTEEEWNKAAADPDAWAKKLREQFITPAEKAKMKEREDKLAAEIRESIAEGLRKAGIKPAGDRRE